MKSLGWLLLAALLTRHPACDLPQPQLPISISPQLCMYQAVNKLDEAMALVQGSLRGPAMPPSPATITTSSTATTTTSSPVPLSAAIDLGAAPGAWTSYLADHCRTVVAVDPGQLSSFALRANVHHLRMRAQEASEHIHLLLGQDSGADLLVCDMNIHPAETSKVRRQQSVSVLACSCQKHGFFVRFSDALFHAAACHCN